MRFDVFSHSLRSICFAQLSIELWEKAHIYITRISKGLCFLLFFFLLFYFFLQISNVFIRFQLNFLICLEINQLLDLFYYKCEKYNAWQAPICLRGQFCKLCACAAWEKRPEIFFETSFKESSFD